MKCKRCEKEFAVGDILYEETRYLMGVNEQLGSGCWSRVLCDGCHSKGEADAESFDEMVQSERREWEAWAVRQFTQQVAHGKRCCSGDMLASMIEHWREVWTQRGLPAEKIKQVLGECECATNGRDQVVTMSHRSDVPDNEKKRAELLHEDLE